MQDDLQIQIVPTAICLITCKIYMNILLIIKLKILMLVKC